MSQKTLIWLFMGIGSTVGGAIPALWGASFLSVSSVILTGVGGMLGIYIGFKMGN